VIRADPGDSATPDSATPEKIKNALRTVLNSDITLEHDPTPPQRSPGGKFKTIVTG
jgi:hypothetical protein